MAFYSLAISTSNGLSQCIHFYQSCCRSNLAQMVTGAPRSMGSNILEEFCNISHLMTRVVLAGIIFLGAREI